MIQLELAMAALLVTSAAADPAPEPTEQVQAVPQSEPAAVESAPASAPAVRLDRLKAAAFGQTDKTKVVVMELRGSEEIPADLLVSLSNLVSQTLEELGPIAAISSTEIDRLLELQELREQLGCEGVDSCLAEIGGALGADYLVSSQLTLVGGFFLLQMKLLNIHSARADARVEREYQGGPKGLLEEVRVATKLLVRDLLQQRSGLLALQISEEAATVRVDGSIVGMSPLAPMTVSGGMHTVEVEKTGFVRFARDVEVGSRQETALEVRLRPSPQFLEDYEERAGTTRALAWVALGAGAAGLAGGVGMWFLGESQAEALREKIDRFEAAGSNDQAAYEEIRDLGRQLGTLDVFTLITAGFGVMALGTGGLLFLLGDDPARYDELMWDASASAVE